MGKTIIVVILVFVLVQVAATGYSAMQSAGYRIRSSVLSGGGPPMASAGYQVNATLGQPTPLMDPNDPPYSNLYDLYPGFWYTAGTGGTGGLKAIPWLILLMDG